VQHPISDEEWNKQVSLDPSPAVLLGSGDPSNANSSPASTLHPFVFVFLLFVFVPLFDF
jgi:hypothetical protein